MIDDERPPSDPVSPSDGSSGGDEARFAPGSGRSRPSIDVIRRIADENDVSPFDLPPLHETVDADSLDSLFDGNDGSGSSQLTATFSYVGRSVRIDADGSVRVAESGATGGEWDHVSPIAGSGRRDVATRIVTAIAKRSSTDPARIRDELADIVDFDSLSELSRRRPNGALRTGATVRFSALGHDVVVAPDGSVSVGSAFHRLKQTGGNVLVVGSVPDPIVDVVSSKLLGGSGRHHLFALLDRNVEVVSERLSDEQIGAAHVVDHATTSRSAATARSATDAGTTPADADTAPTITRVSGGVDAIREGVLAALSDRTGSAASPGELRVCVDSLRPVLEDRNVEGAIAVLEPICRSVKDAFALGHYVLPVARSSDAVRTIEPLFDATVELRVNGTVSEQRWHLHESEYATDWFELRDR